MKVSGGLVGITLQPSARATFFLIAPELARLETEALKMAGVKPDRRTQHHGLSKALLLRHESNIRDLTETLKSFTNPFAVETDDL